jgi:hypothetical protein
MTVMPSGPIPTDSLLSYARVDGESVRVVLALPDHAEVAGPQVLVRFQAGEHHFRTRGQVVDSAGRTRVEVTVRRAQVADGVWHLRLRQDAQSPLRDLGARLLVRGDMPVALLFGKTANV